MGASKTQANTKRVREAPARLIDETSAPKVAPKKKDRKAKPTVQEIGKKRGRPAKADITVKSKTKAKAKAGKRGVATPVKKSKKAAAAQETEYEVEEVIDVRGTKKKEYKIKWVGYAAKYNTWEPSSNLAHAQDRVHEFEEKRALKVKNAKKAQGAKKVKGTKNVKDATEADEERVAIEDLVADTDETIDAEDVAAAAAMA